MTIGELQAEIMRRAAAVDQEPHVQQHLYRTAAMCAGVGVLSRLVSLLERGAPLIDALVDEASKNP